jgi:hypothetical protein
MVYTNNATTTLCKKAREMDTRNSGSKMKATKVHLHGTISAFCSLILTVIMRLRKEKFYLLAGEVFGCRQKEGGTIRIMHDKVMEFYLVTVRLGRCEC